MKRALYLLTIALIITVFPHNGYTETIVTDGLVSYWTFDQQDIVGNKAKDVWGKNHGTIVGNPRPVAGRVNGALEFDGFNDYVNLTNLGDFGSQVSTSTFEAWIKTSLRKKRWTTLFKVRDADCAMGWGIDLNGWAERANLVVKGEKFIDPFLRLGPDFDFDENINFTKDVIRFYLTNKVQLKPEVPICLHLTYGVRFPISDGEWHHLVYVNGPLYVGEDGYEWRERTIFINGKRKMHSRGRGQPFISVPFTEPVYLGAGNNRGKAEAFFNGIIDEVRIYNRPLTADEVTQNFKSKIGLSVQAAEKLPIVWSNLKTAQ